MSQSVQVDQVRYLVWETLAELGVPESDRPLVKETVLLRDRGRSGRRFQYDRIRAVWFSDTNVIDFFSEDGQFLRTVTPPTDLTGGQAAA